MNDRATDDVAAARRRDDAELAARTARLPSSTGDGRALRERAEAIDAFFAGYPTRRRTTLQRSSTRAAELGAPSRRGEDGGGNARTREDDERARYARRALARAATMYRRPGDSRGRGRARRAGGGSRGAAHERFPTSSGRAAGSRTRSPMSPAGRRARGLIDWASHAHAELFVATRQLDASASA